MKVVVGTAFRRALASLALFVGLFSLLFTALDRSGRPPMTFGGGPKIPQSLLDAPTPSHSLWDIPIAIGIAAASVLAAALIYPRRPRAAAPTFPLSGSAR